LKAEIINIGDEIIYGQIDNSNGSYIARSLGQIGISPYTIRSVGDNRSDIVDAIRNARANADVIILTGGLGPTHDDITADAVRQFVRSESTANLHIDSIPNTLGTADGIRLSIGNRWLFALPGVPYEMKQMLREYVIPHLRELGNQSVILHTFLKTASLKESELNRLLDNIEQIQAHGSLAFLPGLEGVRLRVTVRSDTREEADYHMKTAVALVRSKIDQYIYGTDNESLAGVIGRILTEKRLTISVAESCTGGLIASTLTDIPGSSLFFERGAVVYSNASKTDLLGVPARLIQSEGAVSRAVAASMASQIRTLSGSDIGLATTGIAGPGGGTPEKPVGLVWIGLDNGKQVSTHQFRFTKDRLTNKSKFSQAALDLLRIQLSTEP
jgi:PncC family amidohydrolase